MAVRFGVPGPITFSTRFGRVRHLQFGSGGLTVLGRRKVFRGEISSFTAGDQYSTVLLCLDGRRQVVAFAAAPGTTDRIVEVLATTVNRAGPPAPVPVREAGRFRQLVSPTALVLITLAGYLVAVAALVPTPDSGQVIVEVVVAALLATMGLGGVLRRYAMQRREIPA